MWHIKNVLRLAGVVFTLARAGALPPLPLQGWPGLLWRLLSIRHAARNGEHIAAALQRLGPVFIKLGQVLSTRADLVGGDTAEALAMLRDSLPPFPAAVSIKTIESELGMPIDTLFSTFEEEAVAAASIAQVHRAVTLDGHAIAVKVLRPDIERIFARDIAMLAWAAERAERSYPQMQRLRLVEVVATLREWTAYELDLRIEAAAATEMAGCMISCRGYRVPAVDWRYTSQRVAAFEWVDGIPISEVETLKAAGFDLTDLVARVAECFFVQALRHGFFHADLHPGNLLVASNGDLIAVDFGIMGRMDWQTRLTMADMLLSFLNEDYQRVAEIHFEAGYVPPGKSMAQFAMACMAITKPILNRPLSEISIARLLGQLFSITRMFEMRTQPQLLLLQKTMMMAEGIGRMLAPEVNMWQLVRAPVEAWAYEHLGAKARIRERARQASHMLARVPQLLTLAEKALRREAEEERRHMPIPVDVAIRQWPRLPNRLMLVWLATLTLALAWLALRD